MGWHFFYRDSLCYSYTVAPQTFKELLAERRHCLLALPRAVSATLNSMADSFSSSLFEQHRQSHLEEIKILSRVSLDLLMNPSAQLEKAHGEIHRGWRGRSQEGEGVVMQTILPSSVWTLRSVGMCV